MTGMRFVFLMALAALLAGCGQLITPSPETTPVVVLPTATPLHTVTLRPTSTPAPATPAPTATATVTPTPIVYMVQPGDTLLVIAAQFGVSAERIQEANGVVDPRRLQVGQQLIIPGPEEDPEEPPTPTPTPLPLTVRRLSFQRTPTDGLWALGEAYNPGPDPVSEAMVQVSLLDGDGELLAAETGFLQLDVIMPDQRVAFAILFGEPPAQFAQYQAVALTGVPMPLGARYYLDMAVSGVQGQMAGAAIYEVSGLLHNVGNSDVESVRLLVTGYDDQNRVVAVRQANLPVSVLRAAAVTPFEVELALVGSPVVTYSVQAQALRMQ